jgi:hypothetical protein
MHGATIKKANFASSIQYSRDDGGVRCFKYTNQSQTDSSSTATVLMKLFAVNASRNLYFECILIDNNNKPTTAAHTIV